VTPMEGSLTMQVALEYGDGHLTVELPGSATVIRAGQAHPEPPPVPDPIAATLEAVRNPLGCAPLGDLVGPGSTVTIAFPDRVKGGVQATSHRKTTLRTLFDELERAGVRLSDVTLVCAIGLHRKNYAHEFLDYLGADNLARIRPEQIVNHDSEDPAGIVDLDDSSLGDVVQMNRHLVESDLTILIGHAAGNPYGGFSGGYKMPSTGLTTWRSIRGHHSPGSVYRDDFMPVSTHSHFRHQLESIGKRMESAMPRPFFAVDAVLDSANRQLGVYAGNLSSVEQAAWPLASARTEVTLPGEPADVLVLGVPRSFHYGPGMGSNPVLMMQAIGASIARAKNALKPNPVVIAAAVCDGWFNDTEFPAYRTVYEALQTVHHPADMVAHEERIATDYEWIDKYRFHHAYHPFHAFSMVYVGGLARQAAAAVYIAGARNPGYARGMGGIPAPSVEDALREARRFTGGDPKVLVVPELSKPAYHLAAGG
jgi:lactate racemase